MAFALTFPLINAGFVALFVTFLLYMMYMFSQTTLMSFDGPGACPFLR